MSPGDSKESLSREKEGFLRRAIGQNEATNRCGTFFSFSKVKNAQCTLSGSWVFSATMIQRRPAIIWLVRSRRGDDRESTAGD